MNRFEKHIDDWWEQFVEDSQGDPDLVRWLYSRVCGTDVVPDDDAGYMEDIRRVSPRQVWESFFGPDASDDREYGVPSTRNFLLPLFDQCVEELCLGGYGFVPEYVEDMIYHMGGYDSPDGFFKDLSHGGCASGMIGMLIYNSDCKDLYCRHLDDMEDFVMALEEETGAPICNKERLPRYTFMCWICYEELAYRISEWMFDENE